MKQIFILVITILICYSGFTQYYAVPDWFESIPASDDTCLYAVGISEPRMEDTALALNIATWRALGIASLLQHSHVMYTSDYFETTSEESRTLVMKETVQELAKIESAIAVFQGCYEIVEHEMNDNGEMIVLIRYYRNSSPPNTTVCSEFFRQDFEVSNTLHLEKIRSYSLSVEKTDSSGNIHTVFKAFNLNNSRSYEISYDTIRVIPKGYYYGYYSSMYDSLDISAFTSLASLEKGLWNAFYESFLTSVIRKNKNYRSQFEVVDDSYYTAIDNAPDKANGSLSRQVAKNDISLNLGLMLVDNNNMLHMSLLFPGEMQKEFIMAHKATEDDKKDEKNEKCNWFLKLFKKRK
ncbi:MAG: hypothetical protein KBB11_04605 [Bacteroidales bacterium]|nr:hypothetical protein [Bacteroidales bacterium]HOY39472.1 hypothetical protein [Bacteroidales bacterium]HQP04668.1 hypothetical protein [Bacteroidales bacterium]